MKIYLDPVVYVLVPSMQPPFSQVGAYPKETSTYQNSRSGYSRCCVCAAALLHGELRWTGLYVNLESTECYRGSRIHEGPACLICVSIKTVAFKVLLGLWGRCKCLQVWGSGGGHGGTAAIMVPWALRGMCPTWGGGVEGCPKGLGRLAATFVVLSNS